MARTPGADFRIIDQAITALMRAKAALTPIAHRNA
jgi:hypothetical protein